MEHGPKRKLGSKKVFQCKDLLSSERRKSGGISPAFKTDDISVGNTIS